MDLDWKFWLSTIFAVVSIYYAREQVILASKKQRAKGAATTIPPWWKTPTVLALAVLAVLNWVPHFMPEDDSAQLNTAVLGWGSAPDIDPAHPIANSQVIVTGYPLGKYKSKYRIAAVMIKFQGKVDFTDSIPLAKSALYHISADQTRIIIHKDDEFLKLPGGTNYVALLVPEGVEMDSFRTLRQAYALGVKQFWNGGGPP